ncbi:MAG TPA: GNAT family N-acetyltransferase [Acidimicrobiales bacterium]|nr:GNAT family N-acetyltransferase [Acidimicrobiales bacterium]
MPVAEPDRDPPGDGAHPARTADLDELALLLAGSIDAVTAARGGPLLLEDGTGPPAPDGLPALLADPLALVSAGWYHGAIVGIGVVVPRTAGGAGPRGVVTALYVEPEARGVGVGEALLDSVVEWCAAHGWTGIDITALPGDRATKAALERAGFAARAVLMHRRGGR